mmetsp:Transcript_7652/g.9441  ORF Transcript_7652/g.9441 Transcript_7652/m.9441 type:complete len:114 (-) Transcript_7652:281-622(-)
MFGGGNHPGGDIAREDPRIKVALNFFRTESASLYKRSMLKAGFKPQKTHECDEAYLDFVSKALEVENERLAVLNENNKKRKSGSVNDAIALDRPKRRRSSYLEYLKELQNFQE